MVLRCFEDQVKARCKCACDIPKRRFDHSSSVSGHKALQKQKSSASTFVSSASFCWADLRTPLEPAVHSKEVLDLLQAHAIDCTNGPATRQPTPKTLRTPTNTRPRLAHNHNQNLHIRNNPVPASHRENRSLSSQYCLG